MILKASQRSGARQLGQHLLKTEENEHVEVYEVSGFVAETVPEAMKEAYALSLGTHCKQYLFSVSLNPPADENVRVDVFEKALRMIEERNGLEGQPRIVVFHEKEGRRHAHAVWSRIDATTMTAKPLPFFKSKLRDIAKQLYLENGWKLPAGFVDTKSRDPRNFTLDEWQQAKRAGLDPKQLKSSIQEAWSISDSPASFERALEERGLFLARGDRRGHVAVTIEGDVFSIARMVGKPAKEVTARLGDPARQASVEETLAKVGREVGDRLKEHIAEAKRIAANGMKPLIERRDAMKAQHQTERHRLEAGQAARFKEEQAQRAGRMRGGIKGAWDVLTGRYFAMRKANEAAVFFSLQRDRAQRDELVKSQLTERAALQTEIVMRREREAKQVLALYRDAARYRQMRAVTQDAQRNRGLELGR